MQAIILAAGKGSRLRPLTDTVPKPLIQVGSKPLIQYTLEALPPCVNEIFIVVNYLQDQITQHIGTHWNHIPVTYVIQEPLTGTAGAVLLLKEQMHDSFLVLNADDLYQQDDLALLCTHPRAVLYLPTDEEKKAGALVTSGRFLGLGRSHNAVCGAYVLGQDFFEATPVEIQVSQYREFGLPQTLAPLAHTVNIVAVPATSWLQVGTPEQLERAQQLV